MLKIRVIDNTATPVFLNVLALDSEDLDAVREEKPVVQHVKLRPLHLLDVAVKLMLLPLRKCHDAFFGRRFLNTLDDCMLCEGRFALFCTTENFTSMR